MSAVIKTFEDIKASCHWLSTVPAKPGQHIQIVITEGQAEDDWKQAVLSLAGLWDHYAPDEANERMRLFREGFNRRFEP